MCEAMEIKDLITDDRERGIFRVHRSSMTSTDLFHRERELIFNRCWIYLGHESEVEKPGDYRRRTVAGRPLFFARGKDGEVRVFLNTCSHRGRANLPPRRGERRSPAMLLSRLDFQLQRGADRRPRRRRLRPLLRPEWRWA